MRGASGKTKGGKLHKITGETVGEIHGSTLRVIQGSTREELPEKSYLEKYPERHSGTNFVRFSEEITLEIWRGIP